MPISPEEAKTIEFYNQNAYEWSKEHGTPEFWEQEFETFNKLLPFGSVIEIGSGGGRDAYSLNSLHKYFGTDISSGLLQEAKFNNPNLPFSQHSLYEMGFSDNTFDGFWASAVLLHIPKQNIGNALGEIYRVNKDSARGFIALKEGIGEEILADGRHFSYYTQSEFSVVLSENNFSIIDSYPVSKGGTTIWLVYFVEVVKTKPFQTP